MVTANVAVHPGLTTWVEVDGPTVSVIEPGLFFVALT
jgi:hypothetical protein